MSCIVVGDIIAAQATFERLNQLLPILEEDEPNVTRRAQRFEFAEPELRWILLDCICASSKCIYIEAMQILV